MKYIVIAIALLSFGKAGAQTRISLDTAYHDGVLTVTRIKTVETKEVLQKTPIVIDKSVQNEFAYPELVVSDFFSNYFRPKRFNGFSLIRGSFIKRITLVRIGNTIQARTSRVYNPGSVLVPLMAFSLCLAMSVLFFLLFLMEERPLFASIIIGGVLLMVSWIGIFAVLIGNDFTNWSEGLVLIVFPAAASVLTILFKRFILRMADRKKSKMLQVVS